jgi:uncharacterized protein (DUF2147 family)
MVTIGAFDTGGSQSNKQKMGEMKKLIVSALAILTLFSAVSTQAAGFAAPDGIWEIEYGDSRYRLSLCNGDSLCAELIWLAESAARPENVKHLNEMVLKNAKRISPYRWKGALASGNEVYPGTILQLSDDEIEITGCQYVVFCRSYKLYRVPEETLADEQEEKGRANVPMPAPSRK